MHKRFSVFTLLAFFSGLVSVWAGNEAVKGDEPSWRSAIRYEIEVRNEPRPLRIHRLWIDLQSPHIELGVAVGDDPDGDGPAEAKLTSPIQLAERAGFVAAVNANAWETIKLNNEWSESNSVNAVQWAADICGWAKSEHGTRSKVEPGYGSLWLDGSSGRPMLGYLKEEPLAPIAVAGFSLLIAEGRVLPEPSEVLHPRTAIGFDSERRWILCVVVDGRRKGYSEGMSTRELAELMAESGCSEALNLDGGGSSILLLRDEAGTLRVMNKPSDLIGPRPVPVILGVRSKGRN